jgi:uncharacterized membrane-anchored protein YhcB (DUF1043 family)
MCDNFGTRSPVSSQVWKYVVGGLLVAIGVGVLVSFLRVRLRENMSEEEIKAKKEAKLARDRKAVSTKYLEFTDQPADTPPRQASLELN